MPDEILSKLLDDTNTENIILYSENNEQIEFQQIAVIPVDDTIFALLHPVTEMPGVAEDEALVFRVGRNADGEEYLELEIDPANIDAIFDIYYKLLAEENNE